MDKYIQSMVCLQIKQLPLLLRNKQKKQKFAKMNDIVMAVTSENIEDVCKCLE